MAFHETRFPVSLSFGATGGPERRTEVVELGNGFEERNTPWSQSRRRYDAGMGARSLDDLAEAIAFFEAREARLHSFRWKDWADYKSCLPSHGVSFDDQSIGLGDDATTAFQLVKTYGSATRMIQKPVEGTVQVAVNNVPQQEGVDWTVDVTTGIVTLTRAPIEGAQVTAGFEFDVPVRFDTDRITASVASFHAGELPDIPVVEVRL